MNEPTPAAATVERVERFVSAILVGAGASPEDAAVVADEIVDAEARGYESQGLMRIPSYVASATSGATTSPTRLEPIRESPSAVAWDAHGGWGHVAALRAMQECVRRATETGSCIGVIRNVGHIGRLGYYVEAAAELGAIGFIACSGNRSMAMMAPWGGREPLLSTNPLAFGFPHPHGDNVVVDVATTQAARGKVIVAAATGQEIPDTWALDADGSPTTDPTRALPPDGTLAPLGGHKGYALAVAVELLCGGLAGSYPPSKSAVFLAAYDHARLTSDAEYAAAVGDLDTLTRATTPRPGFDHVRLPGAGVRERKRHHQQAGLVVAPEIWQAVLDAARSVGVEISEDIA